MRWSRRRHARQRRQVRKMVAMFEQAQRNEDFTALTRLERLIPLKEFCERVTAGVLRMRDLSPSLRKRVLQATFEREAAVTRLSVKRFVRESPDAFRPRMRS